jgi:hypothetical protein
MRSADPEEYMFEEWQAMALDGEEDHTVTVPGKPEALAGSGAIKYTTRFPDPRSADEDVATLEFRGLYADSEIAITGRRLGGEGVLDHTAYFEPCRLVFEPDEDNELVVTCRAPEDRFGGIYESDLVPDGESVPGIWWDVRLEGRQTPFIEAMAVEPELTDTGARLHVETTVVTSAAIDERLTYALRPEGSSRRSGMMERARVETDSPGRHTLEHTIDLAEPARWWPRELGEQNRYTVRAKLRESEESVTTGICEIDREEGHLRVNGERLPIRGVTVLGGTEDDIDRARDLNATVLRAHACVLPDGWYDRCDSEGLVVWQDLPLTGPGEFDIERAKDIATRLVDRQRRHPSIGVYTVHDDPVDPFEDGLGSGLLDRFRFRYRAWRASHDATVAGEVADAFPERVSVVPVVGPPGIGADAGSYYPGWDYGEPDDIEQLLARYPVDIVAECGAGSLGEKDSEYVSGIDVSKHARHADTDEQSRSYQARLLQEILEQLRLADVGALAMTLRDIDRDGMGLYTRDGTQKAAVDAVRRALQPMQAVLADPTSGQSDVVVINDLPKAFEFELHWETDDDSGEFDGTVESDDRWRDGSVSVPSDGTLSLTLHVGDHRIENCY